MVKNFPFLNFIAQVVMPVPASIVVSVFSQASLPVLSYLVLEYCLCRQCIIIHSLYTLEQFAGSHVFCYLRSIFVFRRK
jgi:hypothetical protein